jgi:hypothetical protein
MADTRSSDTIRPNTMAGGCACAAACTTSESATYGGGRAQGPPQTRPPPRPSRTPSQEDPSLGGRYMPLPSTRRAPGRGPRVRACPATSWNWTRLSPGPTGQRAPEPGPQAQVTQARWSPGWAAVGRRRLLTGNPLAAPPLPCRRLACHTGVRRKTHMLGAGSPRRAKSARPKEAPPQPGAGGTTHPSVEHPETSPVMAPAGPVKGRSAPQMCAPCWASGGRRRPRSTEQTHQLGLGLGRGPPGQGRSTPRRGRLAVGPVRRRGCQSLRATPGATSSAGWGPMHVATATRTTPAPRR